jgi:hypothetical protein
MLTEAEAERKAFKEQERTYIKAYSEALPMLIATEWARRNAPDPAAAET